MRLEANISLSRDGSLPDYKVEVKNINSFRFFALSIESETNRHAEILDRGETPKQETRGWREKEGKTVSQRSKEVAKDYRYFPEPDIPPITITEQWLKDIKAALPILPGALKDKLLEFGVSENDADILVKSEKSYQYIFSVQKIDSTFVKKAAADIVNKKFDYMKTSPEQYVSQVRSQQSSKITDEAMLRPLCEKVLAANPAVVEQYKAGKSGVIGFFVGAVMKETGGKADARVTAAVFQSLLNRN